MSDENNIQIIIEEECDLTGNDFFDVEQMMKDLENQTHCEEMTIPKMINYNINYTLKELFLICDYYGITKEMKTNKYNKEEIITFLILFENNSENEEIVCKRQNMWFYMNELKNDKFMKKYILW